jgi:peptide/nickel transport system substrate-binding protein
MDSHEDMDAWRESSRDIDDEAMGDWERSAYAHAREAAMTRGTVLKLGGIALGAMVAGPVASANAAGRRASTWLASSSSLLIGRPVPVTHLDPQTTVNGTDGDVIPQIFDSLIYMDGEGHIFPGLATAWNFSRDGRAVKFKLRRGVTFHDGTPFDAAAVKYSFDRWRGLTQPTLAAPYANSLLGPLTKVVVDDPHTVRFLYQTAPFAPLFTNLSLPWAGIVSPTAVQKLGNDGFQRSPVGTGPYQLVNWGTDGTITLKRNPAHTWATPYLHAPNGKPLNRAAVIDSVQLNLIPDDSTRVAAFLSKEVDLLYGQNALPLTQVTTLKGNKSIKVLTDSTPFALYVIVLNVSAPPFTDLRVRQAVTHAIDRKKLVALALNGQGTVAQNFVFSNSGDYAKSVAAYNQFDPKKARSLLKAAGMTNGVTFDYEIPDVGSTDIERLSAQVIQQDLANVGITMNIHIVPRSQWIDDSFNKPLPQRVAASRNFYSNRAAPDTGSLLNLLFGGAHKGPGIFRLASNDLLDTWLDQQATIINQAKRRTLLGKIQTLIAQQVYAVPLFEVQEAIGAQTYVGNVHKDWLNTVHFQELTRS